MSNVAGKAYAMNVVTPMRPRWTWLNRLIFMAARALPSKLGGLLGLQLIHFARWVIIRRDQWPQLGQPPADLANDYMLFCSNFNGTWDQYIDAFADGIPNGLDLFWYASTGYPNSIPVTPFKNYIRANQIDTNYYYNATPGSAQRDIKLALGLSVDLGDIADRAGKLDDAALGAAYDRLLVAHQRALGAPGYAPVASCDTAAADRHRAEVERGRWGLGGSVPIVPRNPAPVPVDEIRHPATAGEIAERQAVRRATAAILGTPSRVDEAPPVPVAGPRDAARTVPAEEKGHG